jgi:hypothetical protein
MFAIPGSHKAVGGAQVDTNDHSHFSLNEAAGQQRTLVVGSVIIDVGAICGFVVGVIGSADGGFNPPALPLPGPTLSRLSSSSWKFQQ